MRKMFAKKRGRAPDWTRTGMIIISVLFLDICFMFLQSTNGVDMSFNDETVRPMDNVFRITTEAGTVETTLPASVEASERKRTIIETVLEEQNELDNFLAFYDNHASVKIYLDGELKWGETNAILPFKMPPGNYWHYIRLPKNYEGMTLRIERISYSEKYNKDIPEIYIGTKSALIYMIGKQELLSLFVGTSCALIAIALIIMAFTIKDLAIRKRMFRLGVFILTLNGWQFMLSPSIQLIIGNLYIADYIYYSSFFGVPTLALAYMMTYPSIRKNKFIQVTYLLSVISYIIIQILQVTDIRMYIEMTGLGHIQYVVLILAVLLCFLKYVKRKEKPRDEMSLYLASGGLILLAIIDLFRYYSTPGGLKILYSRYGIAFFVASIGYGGLKQMEELRVKEEHNKMLNQLAYMDGTTKLLNRYSFELRKDEMRISKEDKEVVILMADLNNLKLINDQYGHSCGDEAIMQIAMLLKKHFGEENTCYRIGGDEFCVISYWEDGRIDQAIEAIMKEAEEFAREKDYPFSVACGYERSKPAQVEECFNRADAKMYEIKSKMKCAECDKTNRI